MTDVGSVAAAYAIVLGGLTVYVASVARRLRNARRIAQALERERNQLSASVAGESAAAAVLSPPAVDATR